MAFVKRSGTLEHYSIHLAIYACPLLAALALAILAGGTAQAGLTAAQQARANAALLGLWFDAKGKLNLRS